MTPELYKRVKAVFMDACECDPAQRDVLIESACGGNEELRAEVVRLLAQDAHGELTVDVLSGRAQLDELLDSAVDQAPLPTLIGQYRIVRKIGQGGMGIVYEAEQDHPRRKVAVKILPGGARHTQLVKRFRREADLLGRLHDPGIARVYEAGVAEVRTDAGVSVEQPFFAMELVDGEPLDEYARRHDLDRRARLELLAKTCDAVQHAHEHGVIHRDLKPANILVEPGGQPKVLDFGVARATDSDIQITTMHTDVGKLIGTVPYMSPEQIVGDVHLLDTRSDIYALGVCLYQLLAGRLPFDVRQKPIPEAARMIREEEPTRLGSIDAAFYGDIDTIVCKAMEKDRQRRYKTAAEFAADIRRHLAHEPITAHPPSTFYQIRKFAKRNRGLVAGLGVAVFILIAGIITSLTFAVRAGRGEQRALLNETASRRASYRAHLTAAEAMSDTDPIQTLQQLEAAPPEYRGWEWHHLSSRVNVPVMTHAGDPAPGRAATVARQADGRLTGVLARGGAIEVFDLQTGDVLAVFSGEGGLSSPFLSPQGSHLAALSTTQQKLIIWNVASRARLCELAVDANDLRYTWFSPDGSLLALQSSAGTLTLRDTVTGSVTTEIAPPVRFRIDQAEIAFDAGGKRIALAARDSTYQSTLTVVSIDGERHGATRFGDLCKSFAFSPDGALLAVGLDQRRILILDASTLAVRGTLYGHGDWVVALAFSPDGVYLASASLDGTTRIWDHAKSKQVRVLMGSASSLAFSKDGALLAAGSSGEARVWSWQHDARRVLRGHEGYVYFAVFSRDPGEPGLIASSAWDDTVRLWDALTGDPLGVLSARSPWMALSYTPDGSRLLARDEADEHGFAVWDAATGTRLHSPRTPSDTELLDLLGQPGVDWQHRFVSAASGDVRHDKSVSGHDETLLATVTGDGVQVIDRTTGRQLIQLEGRPTKFSAMTFSPDGTKLALCLKALGPTVWDVASGARLARLSGHVGNVFAFAFSPDGSRLVTGGNDGNIILWDAESFELVAILRGHRSYVYSVAFSPDGTMLASASGDGTVRTWDSLPAERRWRQVQGAQRRRRDAAPMVDELLARLSDPLAVAEHIRADELLDREQRRAALRVLLRRTTGMQREAEHNSTP